MENNKIYRPLEEIEVAIRAENPGFSTYEVLKLAIELQRNEILATGYETYEIPDGAITTNKVADGQITFTKLAPEYRNSGVLLAGYINPLTPPKLAITYNPLNVVCTIASTTINGIDCKRVTHNLNLKGVSFENITHYGSVVCTMIGTPTDLRNMYLATYPDANSFAITGVNTSGGVNPNHLYFILVGQSQNYTMDEIEVNRKAK